eukprot:jgi/Mesvir1/21878/Mv04253-RA.1
MRRAKKVFRYALFLFGEKFRMSKLTRFRQDSLGGNSRTLMIIVLNTVMEDAAAQVERLQMLVAQLQQERSACMARGGAPAGSGAVIGGEPMAAIEAATGASLPGTAASLPYLGLQLSKKSTNQKLGEGAWGSWCGEMTPEGGQADGEERRRVFGDDHEDEDDNYYDAMGESFDDGVTELKPNMTALDKDIVAKEKVMSSISRQQQWMQEVLQREEEPASRLKSMEREIKAVEAEKKLVLAKLNELESMNRSIKTDLVESICLVPPRPKCSPPRTAQEIGGMSAQLLFLEESGKASMPEVEMRLCQASGNERKGIHKSFAGLKDWDDEPRLRFKDIGLATCFLKEWLSSCFQLVGYVHL